LQPGLYACCVLTCYYVVPCHSAGAVAWAAELMRLLGEQRARQLLVIVHHGISQKGGDASGAPSHMMQSMPERRSRTCTRLMPTCRSCMIPPLRASTSPPGPPPPPPPAGGRPPPPPRPRWAPHHAPHHAPLPRFCRHRRSRPQEGAFRAPRVAEKRGEHAGERATGGPAG